MEIALTPWQAKAFLNKSRFKVLRCGRRAGKTYLAVVLLIQEAVNNSEHEVWFIAPTYKQAKTIAFEMIKKLLPIEYIKSTNETDLSFTLINNSTIRLKGADNEDSLRGVGLNGCVLDEFAFMKPNVWQEIVRPMLADRNGWAVFISTPKGYNHFYELWEQAQGSNWARFHFTTYDNPYIPIDEIAQMKQDMSVMRFEQEIMAEFRRFEGAVWPMFSRDIHLRPKRPYDNSLQHIAGIDFGYAVGHPTAFGVFEINNQGDVHLIDGFLASRLFIEQISDRITQLTQGITINNIYYETARPDLARALSERGHPMVPANKDVELGVAKVGEYLTFNPVTGQPRLTISEHLTDFIRQIENYEWEEVRGQDGKFKQQPKKDDDDACDMIRYALYTHTLVPVAPKPVFFKTPYR